MAMLVELVTLNRMFAGGASGTVQEKKITARATKILCTANRVTRKTQVGKLSLLAMICVHFEQAHICGHGVAHFPSFGPNASLHIFCSVLFALIWLPRLHFINFLEIMTSVLLFAIPFANLLT